MFRRLSRASLVFLLPLLSLSAAGWCAAAGSSLAAVRDILATHGAWLGLVAAFIAGMALNLTPCVYPMIPVTLAFFSGQAAGATGRVVKLAAAYVLGIAMSYALLGLFVAKTGAFFGSWLQQPAVLLSVAAIITALALSMFGLYELRPPAWLTQRVGSAGRGLGGAFVMGLVVGIVAAPCIGPFVLGLLLLVSELASPLAGFGLFFALGLGMGLPYLVLAVVAHRVGRLPKGGAWMVWIKQLLGLALLGLALWMVRPLLAHAVLVIVVALLLAGAGAALGFMQRLAGSRAFLWTRRAVGAAMVVAAVVLIWPRAEARPGPVWTPYTEAALETAQRGGQPAIVDVYADWCVPCVEMDYSTFQHPDVVAALRSVTTLRVDATRGLTADGEALVERYRVYGAPTVLFFDRSGHERRDLRFIGPATVDEMLDHLRRLTG